MRVIEADDMRWMPHVQHLDPASGTELQELLRALPALLPVPGELPHRAVRPQHHVYSHVDPFGFQSFKDRRTIATVLQKAGYRTALVGKYLNGYGEQPVNGTRESSLSYVPPGWPQWMAGSDHQWRPGDPFRGGTYDYFSLVQNVNGRIVGSPGRYSTDVLAEQRRGLAARFGRQPKPWFIWWTPVTPRHGSPVESDDPPVSRRTDGLDTIWVTAARPDWVNGRFDDRITHGSGTPAQGSAEKDVSDKPRYLRQLPELTPAERDAETPGCRTDVASTRSPPSTWHRPWRRTPG